MLDAAWLILDLAVGKKGIAVNNADGGNEESYMMQESELRTTDPANDVEGLAENILPKQKRF